MPVCGVVAFFFLCLFGSPSLRSLGSHRPLTRVLFAAYYSGLDDSKRVKYGVLNTTRDPQGVQMCLRYGPSYFVLKNMRLRTTFSNRNSCSTDAEIGLCECVRPPVVETREAACVDGDLWQVLRPRVGQVRRRQLPAHVGGWQRRDELGDQPRSVLPRAAAARAT